MTADATAIEQALVEGDLSGLTAAQRVVYYNRVCESLGLNPLTKPFAYIKLNGKLTLYALRDCAEQLRKIHKISISELTYEVLPDESYIVRARFTDKDGRTDYATGAVSLKGLTGEARTNKMLTAETKCKRRGTYSICGMGMLDETEVESVVALEQASKAKFPRLRDQHALPMTEEPVRTMADILGDDAPPPEPAGERRIEEPAAAAAISMDSSGPPTTARTISPKQMASLRVTIREYCESKGLDEAEVTKRLHLKIAKEFEKTSFKELTEPELTAVVGWVNAAYSK